MSYETIIADGISNINPTTLKSYRDKITTTTNNHQIIKKRVYDEEEFSYIPLSKVKIYFETSLTDIPLETNKMLMELIDDECNLYQDEVVLSLNGSNVLVRNRKRNKMTVQPLFQLNFPNLNIIERLNKDFKFTNSVSIKNNRHLKYSPPFLKFSIVKNIIQIIIKYEIQIIESIFLTYSNPLIFNIRGLITFLNPSIIDYYPKQNQKKINPDVFYKSITEKAKLMTENNLKSNLFVEDLDIDLLPFQIDSIKWMLEKEGIEYDETLRLFRKISSPEIMSNDEILKEINKLSFGFILIKLNNKIFFFNKFTSNICSRNFIIQFLKNKNSNSAKGILAEEMGLGKTIEILSLSLLNQRPFIQLGEIFQSNNDRQVEKIKSTLIIVPDTILQQWIDEIQLHSSTINLFWYKGRKNHPNLSNIELKEKFKRFDFIITSYTVITSEIHSALYNPTRIKRTRTSERIDHTSPLVMVEFWRLIWDESQMIGGINSNVCTMSTLIPRIHSWSVSGTPIKNNNVDDLISTLIFLRVEPFVSQKTHFNYLTEEEFFKLFENLGIRHTKQMVSSQISIPPQQRILLSVPFGKIQQDLYQNSFKKFLKEVNLDEMGNSIGEESIDYSIMNEWLRKLRRQCCHPFLSMVGKEYKKFIKIDTKNKNKKKNKKIDDDDLNLFQSNESMNIVLQKIIKDLNDFFLQIERDSIISNIELGLIYEFEKNPFEALKIWEIQRLIIEKRIEKLKKKNENLTNEIENSSMELLHRIYFYLGNAHYQCSKLEIAKIEHQEKEIEYYNKAQLIRRQILKKSIEEIEISIKKIDQNFNFKFNFNFNFKFLSNLSKNFQIRLNSLINLLNFNMELILKWKKEIEQLFKLPIFDSNSDPNGEEYMNCLNSQINLSIYLDFFQKIIQKRDFFINGIINIEELDIEEFKQSEESILLKNKLNEEYLNNNNNNNKEKLSLRFLLIEARFNKEENEIIYQLKDIFVKERKNLEILQKLLRFFNDIFNSQIKYYRQLQSISDNCISFNLETHMNYDIYDNRRRLNLKIEQNQQQLNKINQRLRFLNSLNDDDDEICIICQGSILIGSFTKCGHRFCKNCLNEWLSNKSSCPICNEIIQKTDIYEFNINKELIDITKNIEHEPSINQLDQLYSKYSECDLLELNTINIKNDYGTKINLIVRQVLFLKEKDDNVQILVYSQWSEFLSLIAKAFEENGIFHLSSKYSLPKIGGSGISNIKSNVEEFKSNPKITCFLLNSKSNASGLNLVNATHVFLCEPLVQIALELQAISRIHRIGQKSSTTIWCFIIKDTVEESIILSSTRKKLKEKENLDTKELTKNSKNLINTSGEIVDDSELWNSFFTK